MAGSGIIGRNGKRLPRLHGLYAAIPLDLVRTPYAESCSIIRRRVKIQRGGLLRIWRAARASSPMNIWI
jgi:hypothetical protein